MTTKTTESPEVTTDTPTIKRTNYDVSAERFIEVWQTSKDLDAVCETTGMPRKIASMRATAYRKAGVTGLKEMPRGTAGGRSLDVASLQKVADAAAKEARKAAKEAAAAAK